MTAAADPRRQLDGQQYLVLVSADRVIETERLPSGDIQLKCMVGDCAWRPVATRDRYGELIGAHIALRHTRPVGQ